MSFDIGGTLVRADRGSVAAEVSALVDVPLVEVRRVLIEGGKRARTSPELLAPVLARRCGTPEAMSEIRRILDRRRAEYAVPRLYADVLPVLRSLRRRSFRILLLSNVVGVGARDREPRFFALADGVFLSCDTGHVKPELGAFRNAEEVVGLRPGELVHVGDSFGADVTGAWAAGWSAILLDRGGSPPPAAGEEHSGVCRLTTLEALLDLLPESCGR
ncbi:MAG: HAD family hydrolase [Acidimicrobiia bacterium]